MSFESTNTAPEKETKNTRRQKLLQKLLVYGLVLSPLLGTGSATGKEGTDPAENKTSVSDKVKGPELLLGRESEEKLDKLREYLGPFASRVFYKSDEVKEIKAGDKKVRIEFENKGNLKSSVIKDVIRRLPKNWVDNEVSSISFSPSAPKSDVPDPGWTTKVTFARSDEKITFYDSVVDDDPTEIKAHTFHEFCHANDWASDNELSVEERIDLLYAVSQRLFSADRIKFSYVENIKKDDKFQENYIKAAEYWAEACMSYFWHPSDLDEDTFNLVDGFVLKNDPDYHNVPHFKVVKYIRESNKSDENKGKK